MSGRPSDFSQELADWICENISDGCSLRSICRQEDAPSKSTVFKWLSQNSEFADQYARAMEARADSHADDIVDIADDPNIKADDKRVMIDARKWTASKLRAKKYGERALLGSDPENPLPTPAMLDASKLSTETLRELMAARNAADPR